MGDKFQPESKAYFDYLRNGSDGTYSMPEHGWACFHCGEIFRTPGAARDHFGATPEATAGCLLKVMPGEERGLLMTLRKVEADRDEALARLAALRVGANETDTAERCRASRQISASAPTPEETEK